MRTKRGRSVAFAAVVAAGLALVVSACGGGGSSGTTTTVQSGSGKTFALLKVVNGTTDYLDPGLSYRLESWQLFQDTYLGLVVKAHVSCQTQNCTKILPGLATTTGTVTNGGKNYKFTLRSGLKYSNGEPVKASDFKSTIIRDFVLNSPGIGFFSNIVGIDACEANPTKCKDISGIVTDDNAGTVEIKLKQPASDFLYVLSIPFTSVVPGSTPQKDTENPPPPANGPYYFASYAPSKSMVMQRNPYWKKGEIASVPDGNPDKISITLTDDQAQSAQLVASGQYMYDANILPTDRLAYYKQHYAKQINFFTTPSTYYFFMNQRTPPFNKLQARQAVNYAVNRQALVNLRGGLGVPTWNFLPPSYPQYKKITPTPYPYDLAKAKQLVQQSGTKGMKVTVYTIGDVAVDKATGEYLQGQLKAIGWNAQIRELAGANYFTIVGNQSTKAQIGFTNWFEDYPYPTDWFNVLQNGENITQVHNNNYGNVDNAAANSQMAHLAHLPPSEALSSSTNAGWAKIDHDLMVQQASTVPYLNVILTSFFNSKMDLNCDIFDDNNDDLAQMCMK
ncbi:MAG TPA: ABC transporter substrate-binding protein [Gaiellaceae bacterium]|nr:ABC transporter substrate-binding protein [Gaiellaceae bacterium]